MADLFEGPPPVLRTSSEPSHTFSERCWDTARENDWYEPFPEGEELRRLTYRLYLEVQACLEANGYPTVDPPSEEAFMQPGPLIWHPFARIGRGIPIAGDPSGFTSPSDREQLEAQRVCNPHTPALWAEELAEQEGPGDSP